MESLFDAVVSEPVALDTESDRSVFLSWVRGLSAREVVGQRLASFQAEVRDKNAEATGTWIWRFLMRRKQMNFAA